LARRRGGRNKRLRAQTEYDHRPPLQERRAGRDRQLALRRLWLRVQRRGGRQRRHAAHRRRGAAGERRRAGGLRLTEPRRGGSHRASPAAYREELRHFVACVRDGSEPCVGGEDAVAALELAIAAERCVAPSPLAPPRRSRRPAVLRGSRTP
jgi:hypothetical protein